MTKRAREQTQGCASIPVVLGIVGAGFWMLGNMPETSGAFAVPLPLAVVAGVVLLAFVWSMWAGGGGLLNLGMMLLVMIILYVVYTGGMTSDGPCAGAELGVSQGGECLHRLDTWAVQP